MGNDKLNDIIDQDISVQSTKSTSSHSAIKGSENSRGALGLNVEDRSVRFGVRAADEVKKVGGWKEAAEEDLFVSNRKAQPKMLNPQEYEAAIKIRMLRKRNEGHRTKIDLAMYEKISKDIKNFMEHEFQQNNDQNKDILIVGRKIQASLADTASIATYFRSNGVWASIAQDIYSRDVMSASGGFEKKSTDELEESSKKVAISVDEDSIHYKPETVEAFFEELGKFKFGRKNKNVRMQFDKEEQFSMQKMTDSQRKATEDGFFEKDDSLSMSEQYRQYVYKNAIKQGNQMCVIL